MKLNVNKNLKNKKGYGMMKNEKYSNDLNNQSLDVSKNLRNNTFYVSKNLKNTKGRNM